MYSRAAVYDPVRASIARRRRLSQRPKQQRHLVVEARTLDAAGWRWAVSACRIRDRVRHSTREDRAVRRRRRRRGGRRHLGARRREVDEGQRARSVAAHACKDDLRFRAPACRALRRPDPRRERPRRYACWRHVGMGRRGVDRAHGAGPGPRFLHAMAYDIDEPDHGVVRRRRARCRPRPTIRAATPGNGTARRGDASRVRRRRPAITRRWRSTPSAIDCLLVGGSAGPSGSLNDTWARQGSTWSRIDVTGLPADRGPHALLRRSVARPPPVRRLRGPGTVKRCMDARRPGLDQGRALNYTQPSAARAADGPRKGFNPLSDFRSQPSFLAPPADNGRRERARPFRRKEGV